MMHLIDPEINKILYLIIQLILEIFHVIDVIFSLHLLVN